MKLKKLLAAVTAAALAVTTVAVTSFTASAANMTFGSTDGQWAQADFVTNSSSEMSGIDLIGVDKVTFNAEALDLNWGWNNGKFSTNSGAGYKDKSFGGSESDSDVTLTDTGDFSVDLDISITDGYFACGWGTSSDNTAFALRSIEFYKGSEKVGTWANGVYTVGDVDPNPPTPKDPTKTWIKVSNTEYKYISDSKTNSSSTDEWNDDKPSTKEIDFVDLLPAGKTIADIRNIEVNFGITGGSTGGVVTTTIVKDGDPNYEWVEAPITNGKATIDCPNGICENNVLTIRLDYINYSTTVIATVNLTFADGGDTPAPTLTLTPNTLTVAKDATADITITAANADGYTFTTTISNDTIVAVVKTTATTVTVEGKAAGTATITVTGTKSGADDITATCAVTVTDSAIPPDPSHTHTPADTLTSDATGHWHACAGCDEKLDLAAHTSDNGTVTTAPTETAAGIKTYKCTVCNYVLNTETIPATGTAVSNPSNNVGAPVIPVSGVNNSNVPVSGDKSGWEAISSDAASASDGDRIVVDMNGTTKIPSTIFKDISGKDVDLVLNMGSGIKWTINGLSVTSNKTIDFDVTKNTRHIPNEAVDKAEGRNKKQISLDHNGSFGCTATMTYDIGTKNNGLFANLFYYNPKTKELELIDCSMISGGKANFVFTHASDYLITITDEPLGDFEDVSSAAGIASNGNVIGNGIVFSAVLTAIVLGFGIIVYRKRRHN